MRKSRNPERDRAIFDAYQSGLSTDAVAIKLCVHRARVHVVVHEEAERQGVKVRPSVAPYQNIPMRVLNRVMGGCLSIKKAAKKLGCSPYCIRRRLRQRNFCLSEVKRIMNAPRDAELYRRFAAGDSLRSLAAEYHLTLPTVSGRINRHRRRNGIPTNQFSARSGRHKSATLS